MCVCVCVCVCMCVGGGGYGEVTLESLTVSCLPQLSPEVSLFRGV